MDLKLLEEIGLTQGEVKVYLALLKLGSTKTGLLALKAGVSSSKVYKILGRLEKKGLAGHVLKSGVKFYSGMAPRRVIDYIDEREKQLQEKRLLVENMLPELEASQKLAGDVSEATIFDGFKAVTNFFRNALDELKPGETYYVIGAGYGEVPHLREFFYGHHRRRAAKKIKLKMLANFNMKENIVETTSLHSEIRFLPQYLVTNMQIVFFKNKVFIILWTQDPKGFLLESKEAVKSFQAYFDAFWKIAKP
ncbi:MAG: helix-turn-helix domain-containing protein [Candidatus Micrarchaeota archaeon]